MRATGLCIIGAVLAAAGTPGYGPEPWLSGNPVATPATIITSVNGTARFTILSSALVRMEWSSHGGWEDARTLVVWNRALPAPQFSVSVVDATTTITTSAMRLVHIDDGAPLSPDNLYVDLLAPAFSPNATRTWTPALSVSTDPGQLFGTFHTLDDGFQPSSAGLNCSLLDPNNDSGGAADFFPCGGCFSLRCLQYNALAMSRHCYPDFGLLSTSGWSLLDDSKCVRMLLLCPCPCKLHVSHSLSRAGPQSGTTPQAGLKHKTRPSVPLQMLHPARVFLVRWCCMYVMACLWMACPRCRRPRHHRRRPVQRRRLLRCHHRRPAESVVQARSECHLRGLGQMLS